MLQLLENDIKTKTLEGIFSLFFKIKYNSLFLFFLPKHAKHFDHN